MMHKNTMDATKVKADVMTWVSEESARSTLGGKKVAKGGMKECDGYIVCPRNLNDCLQVHQDVDYFVSFDPKELRNARCREGDLEEGDGRDDAEEMRKMLRARQCLRIEPIQARVHF